MDCPLCASSSTLFSKDKVRSFFRCSHCDLIFVPKNEHLNAADEKKEYDQHQNGPEDLKYREFLSQVLVPLQKYLTPEMKGLDFGSGPGPTLNVILKEKGFSIQCYDPYYANDPKLLEKQYDFVTCTEVVEHFSCPKKSWKLLTSLVKKGGYLAIMTLFSDLQTKESFPAWWYKNNKTHIAFYSLKTLKWIAKQMNLELLYSDNRTALFIHK
ncbi:MAG: 2-polyprenyl-3-methyl-5-hydroxy-6-metoxy-1,4-benzoquinol methylase [Chlamydiae bacterium CG10_big_fil_rev_8_21_14_0_10_42_34]|nr:MAG: 2-polyprenyl-3-methyl-5-hydroxy-6-metoxy-1,4-benzoquinol methylase [Chlamydiae bacterium CG10_big_fil_rev_8_21_14_0_10_42_34]